MPTSASIYFDVLLSAFSSMKDTALIKQFIATERKFAMDGGLVFLADGSWSSNYLRSELIELAIARINEIKAEQRRLFGETNPIVETEDFFA
jgi:hypothetical protein